MFFSSSHERHDFRGGGGSLNMRCVLWFSVKIFSKHLEFYEALSEILSWIYVISFKFAYQTNDFVRSRRYNQDFEVFNAFMRCLSVQNVGRL